MLVFSLILGVWLAVNLAFFVLRLSVGRKPEDYPSNHSAEAQTPRATT